MRDNVSSTRYSSVCNVLRQWNIPLIPTYRVYRLYDRVYRLYDILRIIIMKNFENKQTASKTEILIIKNKFAR